MAASFELPLAELGIEVPPPAAALVGPMVEVELFLVLSTVDPDRSLDPAISNEQHQVESRIGVLLQDLRRTAEGYALAREYLRAQWDDAAALNRLAARILALEGSERRDFALASEAAERADQLTSGGDAPVLSTLARIQFELGQVERALELQRRAVAHLEGLPGYVARPIRADLERYQAAAARP